MSDDLIAEALELSEKATPGPWRRLKGSDRWYVDRSATSAGLATFGVGEDAGFCARARTLVPELADALADERALADQLAEALDKERPWFSFASADALDAYRAARGEP